MANCNFRKVRLQKVEEKGKRVTLMLQWQITFIKLILDISCQSRDILYVSLVSFYANSRQILLKCELNFGQISRDSWICMCQGENLIKCYTLYEMNISITCIYRKIVFNFSANLASISNKTHSLLNFYLINVKMFMKNDAIINQLVFILCETLILYVFIQI